RIDKEFYKSESQQSQLSQTTIAVMIVYTDGALSWMNSNGGVNTVINQSMAMSQEAHDVSNTMITLDLVHFAHINYSESGVSGGNMLGFIRDPSDGIMDIVHSWRNTYEADLVALFAEIRSEERRVGKECRSRL